MKIVSACLCFMSIGIVGCAHTPGTGKSGTSVHVTVVDHLLRAGANARVIDQLGRTAAQWATRRGYPELSARLSQSLHQVV